MTAPAIECAPTEHEWGWIVGPVAPRGMLTRMTCVCQTCGAVYADPAAAMDVGREMFEIDHEEEAAPVTAPTEARITALEKVAEAAWVLAFEPHTESNWNRLEVALEELNESSRVPGGDDDEWGGE